VTIAMSSKRLGLTAWLVAGAVAVAAVVIGFVWLPSLQASALGIGVWDAICHAAGITRPAASASIASSAAVPTAVVWNTETVHAATSGDAQRAKALALACAGCHGAEGVSPSEAFPNLAGLSEEVMYKALKDYRDGKRQNPTMQGIAGALNDQKIADLAAFYASLASPARNPSATPPSLVAVGNPIRSIAPCAACHGPLGRKDGAPSLEGQKRAYLKAQLDAFASGTRHNDINQQMRQIARALSPTERDSVAEWYGNQHSQ
jgi:cytochrome c553